jgi:hypothetical protein
MVSLWLFKTGEPLGLKISIRSELDGWNLVYAYMLGSEIRGEKIPGWYEFEFPEIEVTPGQPYYIVWEQDGGEHMDIIYWIYGENDQYPDGCAWHNAGGEWKELSIRNHPDPDFCFKTYYAKTKKKTVNPFISDFLENYPHLFPILRHLFGL